MDSNYVFLCGVMWCRYGQQDAGKELLRAAESNDPDISELAWAMLAKGTSRLRELEKRAQAHSRTILGENYEHRVMSLA
jgi:hypothetical protein